MGKKRKNLTAKIVAGVALGAIVLSVVGTGILFVVSSFQQNNPELSREELEQLLDNLPDAETQTGSSTLETDRDVGEISGEEE